jgi:AcrR family transcriptional regulator
MDGEAEPMSVPRRRATAQPCPPFSRRRGQVLEQAIFDATIDELRDCGFTGLTMEGVAASARTGKAALYRRWGSKEELVIDALNHALPPFDEPPDHGSVRDDLLELLRQMTELMNSPTGCAIQAIMSESNRDRGFIEVVKRRVLEPRKRLFRAVLQRAADRGEVRADAAKPLVADIGPAMVAERFHASGPPVPDAYLVSVVDDVVMPLLRP